MGGMYGLLISEPFTKAATLKCDCMSSTEMNRYLAYTLAPSNSNCFCIMFEKYVLACSITFLEKPYITSGCRR